MAMPDRSAKVLTVYFPPQRNRFWLCLLTFSILCLAAPEALPQETSTRKEEDREAALFFNTASRLDRQNTWLDAAAAFGDFLRRFPRHPDAGEAHFARGFCLNRLNQHAAAVQEFEAA